jgi:hypothetical protein
MQWQGIAITSRNLRPVFLVQVHAVLRACTQPVLLEAEGDNTSGGSSRPAPAAGSAAGEGEACACTACTSAARLASEAPALACRAPPPPQPPAQRPGADAEISKGSPATWSRSTAEVGIVCTKMHCRTRVLAKWRPAC